MSLPLLTPPCRNRPFRSRASTLRSKPSQWACCFPNAAASLITLLTAVLFGSNRPSIIVPAPGSVPPGVLVVGTSTEYGVKSLALSASLSTTLKFP